MQTFNGLTMGLLNHYRLNLDLEKDNGGQDKNTDSTLKKIESILQDNNISEVEKNQLNEAITDNFLIQLDSYLNNNGAVNDSIKNSLISTLNSYAGDKNDGSYINLAKLATKLGLKENAGKWVKESQEVGNIIKPSLEFNGKLDGINPGEKKYEKKGGLYGGLDRDNIAGNETISDDKNLYKAIQNISTQLNMVGELMSNSKLKGDESLNKIQNGLNLVKTVVDYPTLENVKILQKFISENLDQGSQEKNDFDKANKRGENFDGKFGVGTLKGVNIILGKTEEYIKGMKGYLKQVNEAEHQENINKIRGRENITISKGDSIMANDLVEGLSQGMTANLVQEVNTGETGEVNVNVEIKQGDDVIKTLNIRVKIVENAENVEQTQQNLDTNPLTIGDAKYQVMGNSLNLANNAGLTGVTFYTINKFNGEHPGEGQNWETVDAPATGDYECYMKYNGNLCKVKVDQSGCLCPVITKFDNKLTFKDGSDASEQVLLLNNMSSIRYLQNKLPDAIRSDCKIGWNDSIQDYVLESHGRILSIEPMTIAGDWISKDLSKNLAFLNLTNYIRSLGDEHGKKDPDVNSNLIVKGIKVKGKELKINKLALGLNNITDDEISRFKKYNNGEDWRDDWDKKKKNKFYKKMDLSGINSEGATSVVGGSTAIQNTLEQGNASGQINNPVDGQINDPVDGQVNNPVDSQVNNPVDSSTEDIKLKEIVVEGSRLRPKKPIDFISGDEQNEEGKNGKLEGIGSFDDDGNFKFENGIQELTQGDKQVITLGDDKFTKVDYVEGKGFSIPGFTGKGYQSGNSGAAKWFFIGEYKNEEKAGKGKRIFENGAIYDGNWEDDRENGEGNYKYANGDEYNGDFKDGKLSGKGVYTWKNGFKFEGNFDNDIMTSGTITLNSKSFEVINDGKGLKITSNNVGDTNGKYIDIKTGRVVDSVDHSQDKNVDEFVDANKLTNTLRDSLRGILEPTSISKLEVVKEGEHLIFKNGVHRVNIDIDGILSDKDVFGEGTESDKMKLLFLASWNFRNRLTKVDSISYFNRDNGSNVILLHKDNSTVNIDYSKYGLDKDVTEKFFNSYNSLISRFQKEEVTAEVRLSLDKADILKSSLENVYGLNNKEVGIMMMLMCDKANDFLESEKSETTSIAFKNVTSRCLKQLVDRGGDAVRDVLKDYKSDGTTDFMLHLANYITLTDGEDFVFKYNKCSTQKEKTGLVIDKINQFNNTRGEVLMSVYDK